MAIAVQQAHEGYTWDEWIQFGVPKAGHTRCGEHCRCRLTPYLYVNVSTELQHMSIMAEGDIPARTQRVLDMVRQWEEAGYDAGELELIGLSETAQEEYLKKQLLSKGIVDQEEHIARQKIGDLIKEWEEGGRLAAELNLKGLSSQEAVDYIEKNIASTKASWIKEIGIDEPGPKGAMAGVWVEWLNEEQWRFSYYRKEWGAVSQLIARRASNKKFWAIDWVETVPEYQRKGYAKKLLEAARIKLGDVRHAGLRSASGEAFSAGAK